MSAAVECYQATSGIQSQSISLDLFNSFVAYIDRGERTTRAYLNNLKLFAAWLTYKRIDKPARADIINYRDWLISEHESIQFDSSTGWTARTDANGNPIKISCKASTVKAYLQAVKAFFSWTGTNGLYPNIATNVHTPQVSQSHKKDSLTPADVVSIENSINQHAKARQEAATAAAKDTAGKTQRADEQGKRLFAIYQLAVNAGLRTIEISRANVKDLETKGGKSYLYIWGKGRNEPDQKKPLADEVRAAIDEYLASRTDSPTANSPLFVATGNRSKGKRLAATTISTMIKRALQEAGYNSDRLTAHSLRHTAAANVLQITGQNIYQTQMYLRHSSPKTTETYLENQNSEQDAIIATSLYQHYHNQSGDTASRRTELQSIIAIMNTEQLEQLASLVKGSN